MGTQGHIMVVKDGYYYGLGEGQDMYPAGVPAQLLGEAAVIAADGDWDWIVDRWVSKQWVAPDDDSLPADLRATAAHPDGSDYIGQSWSQSMRPRISRAEMVAAGGDHADLADQLYGAGKARRRRRRGNVYQFGDVEVVTSPSWRQAAAMPVMEKADYRAGIARSGYGIVVDADSGEIVLLDYKVGAAQGSSYPTPIGKAPLDAPALIAELADWAAKTRGKPAHLLNPLPAPGVLGDDAVWVQHTDQRFWFHPSVGGPQPVPLDPYDTYPKRAAKALSGVPDIEAVTAMAAARCERHWPSSAAGLRDGQWLRPSGFPPLEATPAEFPAQRYANWSSQQSHASVSAHLSVSARSQCAHVGPVSKKRCTRSPHSDDRHDYRGRRAG